MNKEQSFWLFGVILLISLYSVNAFPQDILWDSFTFDDETDPTSSNTSLRTIAIDGAPEWETTIIKRGSALSVDTNSNTLGSIYNIEPSAYCLWFYNAGATDRKVYLWGLGGASGYYPAIYPGVTDDINDLAYLGTGAEAVIGGGNQLSTDQYYFLCVNEMDFSAHTYTIYLDGAVVSGGVNITMRPEGTVDNQIRIASSTIDETHIDELYIFNRSLSAGEIGELYNGGAGFFYPFGDGPPPANESNLTITTDDVSNGYENHSYIYNLSIETDYYNVTDTDATFLYDGVYYAPSITGSSLTYVKSSVNYSVTVPTSYIVLNNSDVVYNWFYNVTINTTKTNYTRGTSNQTVYYDFPRLNVSAVNGYSQQVINNFTGNITGTDYYNIFNVTNGYSLLRVLKDPFNYSIYLDAPGYAVTNESNYKTYSLTNGSNLTAHKIQFSLYSENSVYVYVRSEIDSSIITGLTTITVSGNSSETSYNTTNGTIYITGLTDGAYNFKFNSGNYTERIYGVTVASRSYQVLNAYLSPSTDTVILTIKDYDTGATIEAASLSMSRLINSSYVIIESKFSDITGRAQFTYTNNIKYRFYVTKENYTSKTFDLDPVIFSSYDVRINKVLSQGNPLDYSGVSINFNPKIFYNNAKNNLTFYFSSPGGLFQSYGYNISYPGGFYYNTGTNAVGENFDFNISIASAGLFDTVNITYYYDVTTDDFKYYKQSYSIHGAVSLGNNTYYDNLAEDYGLGVFERLLIATLIMLIVGGVVSLLGGAIPGLIVSLLGMGIFTFLGFVPIWVFLIYATGGFILMTKYS